MICYTRTYFLENSLGTKEDYYLLEEVAYPPLISGKGRGSDDIKLSCLWSLGRPLDNLWRLD